MPLTEPAHIKLKRVPPPHTPGSHVQAKSYPKAVQGGASRIICVGALLQHPDSRLRDIVYKRLFEVHRHVLLEPFLPGIIRRLREIFKEA